MKQVIFIREMEKSDIEAVTNIYAEALHPDYISFSELAEGKAKHSGQLSEQAVAIFHQQLVALFESSMHGFFIAGVNNEITGFALASLHKTEAGHEECWLDDIAIKNNWREHGIGTTLVQWVLDWGRQKQAKYILLESGVNNASAHHLFEHLGFQPLSVVLLYDLSPQT